MLSTASTVERWSMYITKAKPRDSPVSLSRGMFMSAISPHWEKIVITSPSESEGCRPPT